MQYIGFRSCNTMAPLRVSLRVILILHCRKLMDTLFKAALLSVLDYSIVDSYMSFDSGKDKWAALEATFGPSGASNELYVMEQFCDYKMTDERSIVQ